MAKEVTKKKETKKLPKKDVGPAAPLFNQKGEALGEISLDKEIFGNKLNESLINQSIRVYLANQKKGTASTKTRAEVSGGGAKPWKQKGTGRARAGSIRAPHWRGGGVVHGPRSGHVKLSLPKKMRRKALLSALSAKAVGSEIIVLEELKFKEPKTKTAAKLIEKLPVKGKSLVVLDEKNETTQKSLRNLTQVSFDQVQNLNTFSVLNSDILIITKNSLDKMRKFYLGEANGAK